METNNIHWIEIFISSWSGSIVFPMPLGRLQLIHFNPEEAKRVDVLFSCCFDYANYINWKSAPSFYSRVAPSIKVNCCLHLFFNYTFTNYQRSEVSACFLFPMKARMIMSHRHGQSLHCKEITFQKISLQSNHICICSLNFEFADFSK